MSEQRFTHETWWSNNTHPLERIYSTYDPNLRAYLNTQHIQEASLHELNGWSNDLFDSDHPLGAYAAGWAAAELSLWAANEVPLEARIEALETAAYGWALGAKELADRRLQPKEQLTPMQNTQLLHFELNAIQALCSAPLMEAVALQLDGHDLSQAEIAHQRQLTGDNLLELAEIVANRLAHRQTEAEPNQLEIDALRGFGYELIVKLGLLRVGKTTLPASIRQDHNRGAGLKTDVIQYDETLSERTRLQIKSSSFDQTESNADVTVLHMKNLRGKEVLHFRHYLHFFVAEAKGEASQRQTDALDDFAHSILSEIEAEKRKVAAQQTPVAS